VKKSYTELKPIYIYIYVYGHIHIYTYTIHIIYIYIYIQKFFQVYVAMMLL